MCKCGYGRNELYFYPLQERYVPLVQVIPPALDVKYNCDYLGWIHWAHAEEAIYVQNILLDLTVHDNAVSLWEAEIEGIAGLRSSWMHSETIQKQNRGLIILFIFYFYKFYTLLIYLYISKYSCRYILNTSPCSYPLLSLFDTLLLVPCAPLGNIISNCI